MNKFLSMLLLFSTLSLSTFAQEMTKKVTDRGNNVEATAEDYERMRENQVFVAARAQAINSLELNEEETKGFTTILLAYTRDKERLNDRRRALVDRYSKEMKEDDTPKDERNETGDFIENYWEIDIAEMELRKDYFDRLEDVITPLKAVQFFANEEMYNRRAKRTMLLKQMPTLNFLVPMYVTYQYEIDDFNDWNRINIDGKVGLDHAFTSTGLTKLWNAAEAMIMAEGISVQNFSNRKAKVMMLADNLQKDWTSLKHADYAREAFVETAKALNEIAKDVRFNTPTAWLSKLKTNAELIDPEVKLTEQASTVYTYFGTAETIVNELSKQVNELR